MLKHRVINAGEFGSPENVVSNNLSTYVQQLSNLDRGGDARNCSPERIIQPKSIAERAVWPRPPATEYWDAVSAERSLSKTG